MPPAASLSTAAASPRALLYGLGGISLLCFMDGVIKHLVASNDALVVTFGRYVFGAAFAVAIWMRAGRPSINREMWRAHAFRGVFIAVSATLFFWSLSALPLAEVIVISFVAPLIIPFVAWAILGEKVRTRNFLAGLIGFAGVLVAGAGAPSAEASETRMLGIAAVIGAAITYAISVTLLRGRAGRDGAEIVGVLAAVIPGAIIALPAIATGEAPAVADLPAFALMGAFAAAGTFCLARAYAGAEAQALATLEYVALIWAALIGWAFFNETPRLEVWYGAAVIIGACLWGARGDGPANAKTQTAD